MVPLGGASEREPRKNYTSQSMLKSEKSIPTSMLVSALHVSTVRQTDGRTPIGTGYLCQQITRWIEV